MAIVKSIVRLPIDLGLWVTAKGIESTLQLDQMRALRCHRGQGYYLARLMTAVKLRTYLRSSSRAPAV